MQHRHRSACAWSLGALIVFSCAWPGAGRARTHGGRTGVERVSLVVSDLARAETFFAELLGFARGPRATIGPSPLDALFALSAVSAQSTVLRAGEQRLALVQFGRASGRRWPADSRSHDRWFQHLALVVSDIDRAHQQLREHGVEAITRGGPQTIPRENPAAGGVRAFYFRDPDGHPLELIWYPAGKGDSRWQRRASRLVLGIDHTAISVRDTQRSMAFYRDVAGLHLRGRSLNVGPEQEALSAVPGARVRITGLGAGSGPGVELLEYEAPLDGRPLPADSLADDLWSTETVVSVASLDAALDAARDYNATIASRRAAGFDGARAIRLRDPDGHLLRLVQR
jgi:catechol 2,3-dioxygenase-like lactoylglutathione lyase family enzyme